MFSHVEGQEASGTPVTVTLLTAALLAGLAAWLIAARAQDAVNRTLAALLLLFAGSTLALGPLRIGATPADAVVSSRVVMWCLIPTPFLLILLIEQLFLPAPRPRWRRAALWLAGLVTAAMLLGIAVEPGLYVGAPARRGGSTSGWMAPGTALTVAQSWALLLAEALAAFVAARTAVAPERSPIQRRQAALVALAFAVLVVNSAGNHLSSALDVRRWDLDDPGWQQELTWSLGAIEAIAVLATLRPLFRAFEGSGRAVAAGAIGLAALDGLLSVAGRLAALLDAPILLREMAGRPLWQGAFAVMLSVAVLRYGLGGVARGPRTRVRAGAGFVVAAPLAAAGASTTLDAYGTSADAWTLAALWLAVPAAFLLAAPLQAVPRLLADRVLLDPRDPDVLREHVRLYTEALRASARRGEGADPENPALRALREELGLNDRDHALLKSALDRSEPRLAPGMLVLDRYHVERELGRGGFGEAFLAHDERDGRDVVIKRLVGERRRSAEALRRFHREARLAGMLEHPRVVAVHGVETVGEDPCLVMEYAPGGSLADRLAQRGRLAEDEVLAVARDVLDALDALHARGVVHRDVKPSNVLFGADGRAKLGDFGVAQDVVSGETRGSSPSPAGTPAYMAPEQVLGLPARPASDLYGVAATMYEALAGAHPIEVDGLPDFEAYRRILEEPPCLPLPGASPHVNAVLARALAKRPEDRFPEARSMARALADPYAR